VISVGTRRGQNWKCGRAGLLVCMAYLLDGRWSRDLVL